MAETRPGAIAPSTDEPSSARSVNDVVSEAKKPAPLVPQKLYSTVTAPIPIQGPAGEEWVPGSRDLTKEMLGSVAHLPDAEKRQHEILKQHTRDFTGRLESQEEFEESIVSKSWNTLTAVIEPFLYPGSLTKGAISGLASFYPDPTEEGEHPSGISSAGDALESWAGQISKNLLGFWENDWVSEGHYLMTGDRTMKPEFVQDSEKSMELFEQLGKSMYSGFATGLAYDLGNIRKWEHGHFIVGRFFDLGLGQYISTQEGVDWINATIPKELAKQISESSNHWATRKVFRDLSTDTGRMLYGLAIDLAIDPLWAWGAPLGTRTVSTLGKVFDLSSDVARAARVTADVAKSTSVSSYFDMAVHLFRGSPEEMASARETFSMAADALAKQSNESKHAADRLRNIIKTDESLTNHIGEAKKVLDKRKAEYSTALEEFAELADVSSVIGRTSSAASAKVNIQRYEKLLIAAEKDFAIAKQGPKKAKKILASEAKRQGKKAAAYKRGLDDVQRLLRVTADEAAGLGWVAEKGSLAWHVPLVSTKTNYVFKSGQLGGYADALASNSPALVRVIGDAKDYVKPLTKAGIVAKKEAAAAKGASWQDELSSAEKFYYTFHGLVDEKGSALAGWSASKIDWFANVFGTKMWQPLTFAMHDQFGVTNQFIRLDRLEPELWGKYQEALTGYSRAINAQKDFLTTQAGVIAKQAHFVAKQRKKKAQDSIKIIDDNIGKVERRINRESDPNELYKLEIKLNMLKNSKAEAQRWLSKEYSAHDVMLEIGSLVETKADVGPDGGLASRPEFVAINPETGKSWVDSVEDLIQEFSIRTGKEREEVVQTLVEMSRRMTGDPGNEAIFIESLKDINRALSEVDLGKQESLAAIQTIAQAKKVENDSYLEMLKLITPEKLADALDRINIGRDSGKPWNDMAHSEFIRLVIHGIVGEDRANNVFYHAANYMGFRGANAGERAIAAIAGMVSGGVAKGGKHLEKAKRVGPGRTILAAINETKASINEEIKALSLAASGEFKKANLKGIVSEVLDDKAQKALAEAYVLVGKDKWSEFVDSVGKPLGTTKEIRTLMESIGIDPKVVSTRQFSKARERYMSAVLQLRQAEAARQAELSFIISNLDKLGVKDPKLGLLTKDGLLAQHFEQLLKTATSREDAESKIRQAVSEIIPVADDPAAARALDGFVETWGARYKPKVGEVVDLPSAAGKEPVAPTAVPVEEVAEPTIKFKTDSGSDYDFVGGKTKRTKTADVDKNLKKDPDQTIFIDEDAAKEVEAWAGTSETQRRVSIVGDEVLLTSFPPVRPAGPAKPAPKVDVPPHMDDVPIEVMERAGVWYDPRPPSLEELEYYVSRDVRIISVHSESSLGPRPSWNVESPRKWDEKLGTPSFVEDMWSHTGSWTVNPWWGRVVDEGPATRIAQPQQITSEARGAEDLYLDQIRFVVRDEPIPGYTDIEASYEATRYFQAKGMVRTVATTEAGPRPYGPAPRPIPEELLDTERGLGFTIAESDEFGWLPTLPTKPAEAAAPQRRIFGRIKFTTEPEVGTYPLEVSQKTTITPSGGGKLDGYAAFNIPKRKVVEVTGPDPVVPPKTLAQMPSEGPSDAVSDLAREADISTVAAFADTLRRLPKDPAKAADILEDLEKSFGYQGKPSLYADSKIAIEQAKQHADESMLGGHISADIHRLTTFLADNIDELKKLDGGSNFQVSWDIGLAYSYSESLFVKARELAIEHSISGVTAEDILTGRFSDMVEAAGGSAYKLEFWIKGEKEYLKNAQKHLDDAGIDYKLSTPVPSRAMLARRVVKDYYYELSAAIRNGLPAPEPPTLDIVRQPPGLPKKGAGYETFGAGEGADFSRATMDIDPNTTLDDLFAGVDTSAPDLPAAGLTTPEDFSAFIKTPEGATWYERAAARKRGRGQILRRTLRTRDILGKAWKTDSGVATIPDYEYDMLKQFVAMVGTSRLQNIALSIEPKIATGFMLNEPLGLYMFGEDVVGISYSAIAQGRFVDTTIHELWHSLSRYLPDDTVKSLYKQFTREREAFMRANPEAFDRSGALSSIDFAKDQSTYRFSSFDEWVVEKMKDLSIQEAASRLRVKGTAAEEVPYSKPWQRALGALSDLVAGHYNQMKTILGRDVARKTYMDFMKGKYLDQVRDSPLRDVIKITSEDEARAAARWSEYLDALDLHLKFPLAEKGLAAAEAKMARESEKFLESMMTGPAESLPAGEFRALASMPPGGPPTKTGFPWSMRNTKSELVDAAEKAGMVVPPKVTKAQILDSLKALGPRLSMTGGQRALEAVRVARKELMDAAKSRQAVVKAETAEKLSAVRTKAKTDTAILKAEREVIEEALKRDEPGIYYPGHPQPLQVRTEAGGTKNLPYRAMESWEKELHISFMELTKPLNEEDTLFAAFTALRMSPTAPSELQKWQKKYADTLPDFLGRRLGEVPEDLQHAVVQMRALIKRYEEAYVDRGATWTKKPLDMMREWGVIEFVPHILEQKRTVWSGKLSAAVLSGWASEVEAIPPMNTMDARYSTAMDSKTKRTIDGTILEINTLKESSDTSLHFVLDPVALIARYMQSARAMTAEDFIVAMMRGKVIQKVEAPPGGSAAEEAARRQLVPLFERGSIKRELTQEILFTGDKAAWTNAGVDLGEVKQLEEVFSYGKREPDIFANWMQDAKDMGRINLVEKGIVNIRKEQWLEHLKTPVADELFDPKKIFDEELRRVDFTDLSAEQEAKVIRDTWDIVAKKFNDEISGRGLIRDAPYKVKGEDLSLFYGEGSEPWALYIPLVVRESMKRVLGIGETMMKGRFGQTLDKLNNFFKTRVTVLAIAFSTRNALSNTMSNILDLGVGGALDPSTNILATRLAEAASFSSEYGSFAAAHSAHGGLTDVVGAEKKLEEILHAVPAHKIIKDPALFGLAQKAKDIQRGIRWKLTGMDDLLKNGVDLGDGVTRSVDDALNILETNGVVTPAYRNYVDLDTFETGLAEIMTKGFLNGNWDGAAQGAKNILSIIEDVGYVALTMSMTGGVPVVVPKKVGAWIARGVENQARVTNFIGNMKRGGSVRESADHVAKFLFDYNDLTHIQKKWLRTIFTFFTWNQKNVHLQLEMMHKSPAFYSKFGQTFIFQLPEAMAASQYEEGSYYRDPEYLKKNLVLRDPHTMSYIRIPMPKVEIFGKTVLPGKPGVYLEGLGLPLEPFADTLSMFAEIPGAYAWLKDNGQGAYSDETKFRMVGQLHWAIKAGLELITQKHAHYGVPLRELNNGKLIGQMIAGANRLSPPVGDALKEITGHSVLWKLDKYGNPYQHSSVTPLKNWMFSNIPHIRGVRDASAVSDAFMMSTIATPEEAAIGEYDKIPYGIRLLDALTGIRIVQQHPHVRRQLYKWRIEDMYKKQLDALDAMKTMERQYLPK